MRARKDHLGHGPRYLWNACVSGKTQARNLPLGPALEKVQKKVERYRSFFRLRQELVEVSACLSCQSGFVPEIKNSVALVPNCFTRSASVAMACYEP